MCEGVISITHFYIAIQHVLFALTSLSLHSPDVECLHLLQLVIYSLMKQISTFSSSPSISTCAFLFGHRLLVGHACVACLQDGYVIIFVFLLSALNSWRASFFTPFLTTMA
ncbi:hypothetical protein BDF20DRAFT_857346 [Mycotypha africana]|uniref:uncharacterized protein n=1 Tax=Mycotypha africana TaxID=64632 RepID=UPI002300CC38|nr:uncharacterized protein BDF20DRAFT_857346 [Mycotypha africana]KAI8983984.1 hypothetical protein BDF20DRAFT_857346 [Mycotypha africana]